MLTSGVVVWTSEEPDATVTTSLIAPTANPLLERALRDKLQRRGETIGSLGELEPLAVRIGLIQNTLKPRFRAPQLAMFAADHGLIQRTNNYYNGDSGIYPGSGSDLNADNNTVAGNENDVINADNKTASGIATGVIKIAK